ncbi:MAG: hypothetical protein A2W17_09060 [Planctomycetes bacterium RBG_16_41_13]|nr:MAG: hypothetical protein A2W17_09060 [Planctomycetes bacterium RBG_16_41_13]
MAFLAVPAQCNQISRQWYVFLFQCRERFWRYNIMQQKAATKNSLTTKGTKNTEHKGHKEKLTKKRSFYRVIL